MSNQPATSTKAPPTPPAAAPEEKLYPDQINVKQATEILGYASELQTKTLLRTGKLEGKKNSKGFWKLSKAKVEAYAQVRKTQPRGHNAADGKHKYFIRLSDEEFAKFTKALPEFTLTKVVTKPKAKKEEAAAPKA